MDRGIDMALDDRDFNDFVNQDGIISATNNSLSKEYFLFLWNFKPYLVS